MRPIWYRGVGITTRKDIWGKNIAYSQKRRVDSIVYLWDGDRSQIVCREDMKWQRNLRKRMSEESAGKTWEIGDIITLKVDCRLWKIQFFHNDLLLWKGGIAKNETYYPFLTCTRSNSQTFKVL